jgi:hypothetical protein
MSLIKVNDIQTTSGIPNRGKILQVVQTIKSDTFTTSTTGSNTWVSITGLSASITPTSTSNKILLICDVQGAGAATVNTLCAFRFTRNGSTVSASLGDARTNFFQASVNNLRSAGDTNGSFRFFFNYLDSPASTSAQTYQLQGQSESSGFHINRTELNSASNNFSATAISSITLLEVAA